MTYHKLPEDFNCSKELIKIKTQFEKNIESKNKNIDIENLLICKEPYELEKNPDNKDLVHLHCLVITAKPVRIHSQKATAGFLTFVYDNIVYYPHISPCKDLKGYIKYMNKLQQVDIKYTTEEYNSSLQNIEVSSNIDSTLDNIYENMDLYTKDDARKMLKKFNKYEQAKYQTYINNVFHKLPEAREKFENMIVDLSKIKIRAEHFLNNPNYEIVKQDIKKLIAKESKRSLRIVGEPDTGKTKMVLAAIAELEEESNGDKYLVLKIRNIDSTQYVDKVDRDKYSHVIGFIDDFTPNKEQKEDRDFILNLYEGDEEGSYVRVRYKVGTFFKVKKVFTHNQPLKEVLGKHMREEYRARIKERIIDPNYKYSSDEKEE